MHDDHGWAESEQKPIESSQSKRKDFIYIIVMVLLAFLAAAGVWFYRQAEIDRLKSAQANPASADADTSGDHLVDPDKVANWAQVLLGPALIEDGSGEQGENAGASFRIPLSWTVKQCSNGGGLVAYVSPTSEAQTTCNSEGLAPIVISVQNGDYSDGYDYSDTTVYRDNKTETVKIGDREFTKTSATIVQPMEFQPPAGSKIVSYYTIIDGVTYSATYVYINGDSDDLTSDFIKIVEQTLTITTT